MNFEFHWADYKQFGSDGSLTTLSNLFKDKLADNYGNDINRIFTCMHCSSLSLREGTFLRAGYSANADIVLDQRKNVLAINERLLSFEDDKITVGLSDGINIEILIGLSLEQKVKVPL